MGSESLTYVLKTLKVLKKPPGDLYITRKQNVVTQPAAGTISPMALVQLSASSEVPPGVCNFKVLLVIFGYVSNLGDLSGV